MGDEQAIQWFLVKSFPIINTVNGSDSKPSGGLICSNQCAFLGLRFRVRAWKATLGYRVLRVFNEG